MSSIEIELPDRLVTDIDNLVAQGDFLNREQAVEELLTQGVSAYGPTEEETEEPGEDMISQHLDQNQDPAARGNGTSDDRTF